MSISGPSTSWAGSWKPPRAWGCSEAVPKPQIGRLGPLKALFSSFKPIYDLFPGCPLTARTRAYTRHTFIERLLHARLMQHTSMRASRPCDGSEARTAKWTRRKDPAAPWGHALSVPRLSQLNCTPRTCGPGMPGFGQTGGLRVSEEMWVVRSNNTGSRIPEEPIDSKPGAGGRARKIRDAGCTAGGAREPGPASTASLRHLGLSPRRPPRHAWPWLSI